MEAELQMWEIFQTARGANATFVLAIVIGVWIAARFASVAVEKGVNVVGKLIISVFVVCGFLFGWRVLATAENIFVVQAKALEALPEKSQLAQTFIEGYNQEAFITNPNMIGMAYLIAGLLIALVPLWFSGSKDN